MVKENCFAYIKTTKKCDACKYMNCNNCNFYKKKNKENNDNQKQEKSFNGYFLRDVVHLFSKN